MTVYIDACTTRCCSLNADIHYQEHVPEFSYQFETVDGAPLRYQYITLIRLDLFSSK